MFELKKQIEPKPLAEALRDLDGAISPLAILSAIGSGTLRPSELLEAKHMRGFEEEWKELELLAREHVATLRAAIEGVSEQDKLSDSEDLYARELARLAPEARSVFETRDDAAAYERIQYLVRAAKLDDEPFMRLLQVLIFVTEAPTLSLGVVENFLRAENAASPERRELVRLRRETETDRRWKKVFHEVGLDGAALLDLLKMKPGPDFGRILREAQSAARGGGELSSLSGGVIKELSSRISDARDKMMKI